MAQPFDYVPPFTLEDELNPIHSSYPPGARVEIEYPSRTEQPALVLLPDGTMCDPFAPFLQHPHQYHPHFHHQLDQTHAYSPHAYSTPIVPLNEQIQVQNVTCSPLPANVSIGSFETLAAVPLKLSDQSPTVTEGERGRIPTLPSRTSHTSYAQGYSQSEALELIPPTLSEMTECGYLNNNGSWSCAYPDCSSRSTFTRACDLRKHYKRHAKYLFCRYENCLKAKEGGFSSKKDRARHEAKHTPSVVCEWEGCERIFSRVDNMVSPIAYRV